MITLFSRLYMRIDILLTRGRHVHNHHFTKKESLILYITSIIQTFFFIEVFSPRHESERSSICVLGESIETLSTI
jgi:hypothetical protein